MLQFESMGVTILNENLYDLNSCDPGDENVLLIFFHGLELDDRENSEDTFLRTWTFDDSSEACWPSKMFREDPTLKESKIVVRALATRYDASIYKTDRSGRMDIFLIGENFLQSVIHPILRLYRRGSKQMPIIVLVGHSFGGIVIQEVIHAAFNDEDSKKFLKNLAGIFFYARPHGAFRKEAYEAIFRLGEKELAGTGTLLSELNKELSRSRQDFNNEMAAICDSQDLRNQKEIMIMSAFETAATNLREWTGQIVEEAAARDKRNVPITADHFRICKPPVGANRLNNNRYVFLRDFILDLKEKSDSYDLI